MLDKIFWGTTHELLAFSDMIRLNIVLYNSLDLEELLLLEIIPSPPPERGG